MTREITLIEGEWIEAKLKEKQKEFTEIQKYTLHCVTWNLGREFPNESLHDMLGLNDGECDFYAIGLQEIDMSPLAMIREETEMGTQWATLIQKTFANTRHKYVILHAKQMVGIWNCIVVKSDLKQYIKKVKDCPIGTGALGIIGNKGGVSIRFQFHGSTLCFTNIHLVHKQNAVEKRNQNLEDIFFGTSNSFDPFSHDILILFGDYNYRLNFDTADEVIQSLRNKDYSKLLKRDQLLIQKEKHRILARFKEFQINFPPSYKYKNDVLDKDRIPSYCDRVCYHDSLYLEQKNYICHQKYLTSDHKPVSAHFDLSIKKIILEKYQKSRSNLVSELGYLENQAIPTLKLHKSIIDLENPKFNQTITSEIILENVGLVPVEFHFDEPLNVKWVTISPMRGLIMKNEKLVLVIKTHVDADTAYLLNVGKAKLDTIEILHIKNGGDFFISVIGSWKATVFGNTIENLCKLGEYSIREWKSDYNNESVEIPKEIVHLVNFLTDQDIDTLLKQDGDLQEIKYIHEMLDLAQPIEGVSIHSVFDALLDLLRSLHEPIWSPNMNPKHIATFSFLSSFIKTTNSMEVKFVFASALAQTKDVEELIKQL